jgi:16S rRNA (cytidine1402-2'-O)-methyltransferase
MPGTLFVVATPIGNLEDITARALRVLGQVSLIAAEDTRRTAHLLSRYAITTPTTSLHEHNEHKKTPSLVERLLLGESLALVSDAGTPTISDPGRRLVESAVEAGIRIESVPGPSAPLAALAASGFPSDTYCFLGFPPIRSKDRNKWFDRLTTLGGTIVFFEAPHRILPTLERLLQTVGDRRVVVARELTKAHEELVRGPISEILKLIKLPRGEFTVVVDLGQTTEVTNAAVASDGDIFSEFGRMTEMGGQRRRQAITALARKHGRPSAEIYAAIERAKKLGQS